MTKDLSKTSRRTIADTDSHSEGVKCNSDGSMIIKPCTYQEVDFYETSANHPEVQAFMPIYYGTLSLGAPAALPPIERNEIPLPPASINTALATNIISSSIVTSPVSSANPQSATSSALSPTLSHDSSLTRNTSLSPGSPYTSVHVTPWIPNPNPNKHHGRRVNTDISIVLENVADGFVHPNILDVKLGSRLWADDAPENKRAKLEKDSRTSTSGSLGFRIAGMKVWRGSASTLKQNGAADPEPPADVDWEDREGYRCYNKFYGRKLTEHNVKTGFEEFLTGLTKPELRRLLAARLAKEMRCIQRVLEGEESRMYSSSALIVYEGDEAAFEKALEEEKIREQTQKQAPGFEDPDFSDDEGLEGQEIELDGNNVVGLEDDDEEEEEETFPKVNDVRLIDFAHAMWTPGQGPDENMLQGVRVAARILEELAGA